MSHLSLIHICNIDVNGINDLLGPGGGSKLVARNAEAAIKVETDVKGLKLSLIHI